MAYTITDPAVLRLMRELANVTGEPMHTALATAIVERLARALEADAGEHPELVSDVLAIMAKVALEKRAPADLRTVADIQQFVATLPVLDDRPADELLYDDHGLPR